MNRFTPDGRIEMDSSTIGEIIRETREHGTAERVLITITTPAGNEVVVTLQPTYDATATPSPLMTPLRLCRQSPTTGRVRLSRTSQGRLR
jgi:hypothetical protein